MPSPSVEHDLRNQLTVISSFGEFISRELGKSPVDVARITGFHHHVMEATQHAIALLAVRPAATGIDVNGLALDVGASFMDLQRHIAFAFPLDPELPLAIPGNPLDLKRALDNVVRNACEALAATPDPEISIATDQPPGHVRICIRDNGPGLDRSKLVDGFTTKAGPGHGYGLAIVREAVAAAGGKWCIEPAPHRGTIVSILLPAG